MPSKANLYSSLSAMQIMVDCFVQLFNHTLDKHSGTKGMDSDMEKSTLIHWVVFSQNGNIFEILMHSNVIKYNVT